MKLKVGDRVKLHVPDNPRLHRQVGTILSLEEWGAYVSTRASHSGQYRASYEEMHLVVEMSGEVCVLCGSPELRRSGTCLVCVNCGTTSGCS